MALNAENMTPMSVSDGEAPAGLMVIQDLTDSAEWSYNLSVQTAWRVPDPGSAKRNPKLLWRFNR